MDPIIGLHPLWIVAGILNLAIQVTALVIIPRGRKPTAAMAWLLAIFLIPFIGILLFLIIGTSQLPRKRMQEQVQIDAFIRDQAQHVASADPRPWPRWFQGLVQQNESLTALPAMGGNEAILIGDYQESIDAMADQIDGAHMFVHVEFFIVSWDDTTRGFFSAMERAVARGVTVRLLADHLSSKKAARSRETFQELDRIGVQWEWMLPVMPF